LVLQPLDGIGVFAVDALLAEVFLLARSLLALEGLILLF
jgi:hypothetical protein